MKNVCIVLVLAFLGFGCQAPKNGHVASNSNTSKPNIIYILVDDMGYGDLSITGQKKYQTPVIDQMAREGILFTHHYAGSTVCGPSRAALLTGKHTGHTTVRGNQPSGQLLEDAEITIPEALRPAGYTTAIIGKWGIGHPPAPDDARRNGFDHFYGYSNMWHAHNFFTTFLYRNGVKETLPGNNISPLFKDVNKVPEGTGYASEKKTYVIDEFEKDARTFIQNNKTKPFFLYLALNIPHANNELGYDTNDGMEVPSYGEFASKDWPNQEKGFAQMMRIIDNTVASILEEVKKQGIDNNTIILFTSDNGPHQEGGHDSDFFDSNGIFRGTKRDFYDGGIRLPLIVRWPGKVKPNTTSNHLSAFWDVLPTLCDVAGAPTPAGVDGISFLPTLLGKTKKQKKHESLYWEFYELGGKQAAVYGNWKGIKFNLREAGKQPYFELYDLSKDPSEENNVASQHPEIIQKMEEIFKKEHTNFKWADLFTPEGNAETKF